MKPSPVHDLAGPHHREECSLFSSRVYDPNGALFAEDHTNSQETNPLGMGKDSTTTQEKGSPVAKPRRRPVPLTRSFLPVDGPLTFDRLSRLAETDETFRRINRLQLANDTRARRVDDDTFAIRYKQTDVVLVHRDGTYTLDSGGFRTARTRERMMDYVPVRIMPGDDLTSWYLAPTTSGAVSATPFRDGIRVDRRGEVIHTPVRPEQRI